MKRITKTDLLAFRQCPRRFWLKRHAKELGVTDATFEQRVADGNLIGALAQSQWPGTLIESHGEQALADTRSATASTLHEAAYATENVLVRVDVLKRSASGVSLIEVKSGTSAAAHYIDDAAIQRWVAEQAGVDVELVGLAVVDNTWVAPSDEPNYDGLLKLVDVTEKTEALQDDVAQWVAEAGRIDLLDEAPEQAMGRQCKNPYGCEFFKHCQSLTPSDTESPEQILAKPFSKALKAFFEAHLGADFSEVPDDLLSATNVVVKAAHLSGKAHFDAEAAAGMLQGLTGPLHFLDFESVQFAAPVWEGTRPYEQIVFQYSLHSTPSIDSGVVEHREFLGVLGGNPTYEAAMALRDHLCGDEGSILVYNASFERGRIEEMAMAFPDLREDLRSILTRIVDLLPVMRNCYYHPAMRGSWSLKAVLPCIAPDKSYGDLGEVQNGTDAIAVYRDMVATGDFDPERCQALRDYCALDTEALIDLLRFLLKA